MGLVRASLRYSSNVRNPVSLAAVVPFEGRAVGAGVRLVAS